MNIFSRVTVITALIAAIAVSLVAYAPSLQGELRPGTVWITRDARTTTMATTVKAEVWTTKTSLVRKRLTWKESPTYSPNGRAIIDMDHLAAAYSGKLEIVGLKVMGLGSDLFFGSTDFTETLEAAASR